MRSYTIIYRNAPARTFLNGVVLPLENFRMVTDSINKAHRFALDRAKRFYGVRLKDQLPRQLGWQVTESTK